MKHNIIRYLILIIACYISFQLGVYITEDAPLCQDAIGLKQNEKQLCYQIGD